MALYCPAASWLASKVAVDCVVPFDAVPVIKGAVPNPLLPELNVTAPVGPVPSPEAFTVAVSNNDCAVCCEVSDVIVASCLIVKLIGVKFALELKLLSPLYPAVMECAPDAIWVSGGVRALPFASSQTDPAP